MGTALVMEHANALAQMIVSEKDKLLCICRYYNKVPYCYLMVLIWRLRHFSM